MVGRQLGSCPLPGGCETPLTPIPPFCSLTQVKRKIAGTQSTDAANLAFTTYKNINGFPFCNTSRIEEQNVESHGGGVTGDSSINVLECAGTSFEETTWTISSNAVFSSSTGIYKRNGIQVLATSVPELHRRYTMTSTCAFDRQQPDTSATLELLKTTQNAACSCFDCSPSPANIDLFCTRYESVTTTGTCSGSPNVTFNYIPVAAGDIIGMLITPILGTWSIEVSSNLIIYDTLGSSFTFSGTLTSVVAAINATAGGTLFSATLPANINGTVALVSDLKPFTSKTNQPVSGCVVGLPLIYSGEELAPSSVCEGPFPEVYDFTGLKPLRFDQFAIDAGFPDTHDGYLNWLGAVRTPKWSPSAVVDPDNAWFTDSVGVFNLISFWITPTASSPIGVFKTNWSLTPGVSSKSYSSVVVSSFARQTDSHQVTGNFCPGPESILDCPAGTNDSYPGFCCNGLPDCFPGQPFAYCIERIVTFDNIPDYTQSGTFSVSGYWKFE